MVVSCIDGVTEENQYPLARLLQTLITHRLIYCLLLNYVMSRFQVSIIAYETGSTGMNHDERW